MNIKKKLVGFFIDKLMPPPAKVRHAEYSMIFSAEDDVSQPSNYLISIAQEAIKNAQEVSLDDVSARMQRPPYYPSIWPGEHYKLLAGLVLALKPEVVIEIGTATGLSALSMKKYLLQGSKTITFDIIDWKSFPDSCLREDDFRDGMLFQYVDDLSDPSVIPKYLQFLKEASIIFIDAEKDGVMEQRFLDNFRSISFHTKPLIVLDDIRLWNMLRIWRNISLPKLDLTSFGHWSGTGIIEWK
jgi:predicted O-methyltransferase YrrM